MINTESELCKISNRLRKTTLIIAIASVSITTGLLITEAQKQKPMRLAENEDGYLYGSCNVDADFTSIEPERTKLIDLNGKEVFVLIPTSSRVMGIDGYYVNRSHPFPGMTFSDSRAKISVLQPDNSTLSEKDIQVSGGMFCPSQILNNLVGNIFSTRS